MKAGLGGSAAVFAVVLPVLAGGCIGTCAADRPSAPYYDTWSSNSTYDRPIKDPIQWAADNLAGAPDAALRHVRAQELDLDGDGARELLVWDRALMGQAGGPYLVFRREGGRYRYIGELGAGLYKVLPAGKDGRMRIATYWRMGGGEAIIAVDTNDGSRFITLSRERIFTPPGEEDCPGARRFRKLFGAGAWREGEEFRCDR